MTPQTTTHTATPWQSAGEHELAGLSDGKLLRHAVIRSAGDRWAALVEIEDAEGEANAEFICRACNSHDGLIAALTLAADRLMVSAREADVSAHTFPNAPGNGDFRRLARELTEAEAQARAALVLARTP